MKKKLLLICLLTSVIFCLSACGESAEYETTPNPSDPAVVSENDEPDLDAVSTPDPDITSTSAAPTVQLTAFESLFGNGPIPAQNQDGLWGFIDISGKYVIQPIYSRANSFAGNGLAVVQDASSELWGVINTSGDFIVEPTFYNVSGSFREGLLCVCEPEGGWGYIDEFGSYAIPPQFMGANPFSGGFARVSTGIEYIDEFSTYYTYTYINKSGEPITEDVFSEAYDFCEGRALVKLGDPTYGNYGYIDESGEYIVYPQFDQATSFSDGIAFAHALAAGPYDARTVLIDLDGNILVESTEFDVPSRNGSKANWSSELCPVRLADGSGTVYINKQGEVVLPKSGVPYTSADDFYNIGFAFAGQDTGIGLIDLDGNWIVEPQYSVIYSSSVGGMVQMGNSEVMRLFDTSGNCLMEYRMDSNERPAGDIRREPMLMARYADDGSIAQVGFMNHDGSMAIDYIFENASDFSYDCSYAKVQSGGLWGVIDKSGNWLIPPTVYEPYDLLKLLLSQATFSCRGLA